MKDAARFWIMTIVTVTVIALFLSYYDIVDALDAFSKAKPALKAGLAAASVVVLFLFYLLTDSLEAAMREIHSLREAAGDEVPEAGARQENR